MNPLRACPSNLTFDVAFFDAVGANVRDGIVFKGVAFESDCPEIVTQIPNEGLDVQHEPVYAAQLSLVCNGPLHPHARHLLSPGNKVLDPARW